jgi:hypothetical protein
VDVPSPVENQFGFLRKNKPHGTFDVAYVDRCKVHV